MNQVWLAERDGDAGYDEYIRMVVVASSEEEAKALVKAMVTRGAPDDELGDWEKYYEEFVLTPLDISKPGVAAAVYRGA